MCKIVEEIVGSTSPERLHHKITTHIFKIHPRIGSFEIFVKLLSFVEYGESLVTRVSYLLKN